MESDITWEEILSKLGIPIAHKTTTGKIYVSCVFHQERTPSLRFVPGRFKCYGCGESGNYEDFLCSLFGISRSFEGEELNLRELLGFSTYGNHPNQLELWPK